MTATAPDRDDDRPLRQLDDGLTGDVHLPGDPGYAELGVPWNVAMASTRDPRAVVAVADAADVAAVIRFAAANGLRVAVQRTGHGAVALEGDDILLIHTGRLRRCELDLSTGCARIGAGALWQDVLDVATPHGLAPLCGSSPTVGVVGYLTGGGIGPLVRSHGLSADYVRSFEVVTGEGVRQRASADECTDLFWGLRGGKGTLGIVTELELELLSLPVFHGGALYFAGVDAPRVLPIWEQACRDLPDHTSSSAALLQLPPLPEVPEPLAGRMTLAIRIATVGGADAAETLATPLLAAAKPVLGGVGELPYSAISQVHADPTEPMPAYEASALLAELSPAVIDALLAVAGPEAGSPLTVVELRQLGGALARTPAIASAFSHRDAVANLEAIGVPVGPQGEAVVAYCHEVVTALAPFATGGALSNFAATADPAVNAARCYDEPTRDRLGQLAERHDPDGVLRVGQVVRAGS